MKITTHIFGKIYDVHRQHTCTVFTIFFNYRGYEGSPEGLDLHSEDRNGLRNEWGYANQYSANIFAEKAIERIKNHDKNKVRLPMIKFN